MINTKLTPNEINEIFLTGENEQIEFKSRISNIEIVAKHITAFSNTNGGKLIVGYDERTKAIVGYSPKDLMLIDKALECIDNPPNIEIYAVDCDSKQVLVVDIDKQNQGVSFYNGRIYSRQGDSIVVMSQASIKQRLSDAPTEKILEAIAKLNEQNENLRIQINKSGLSSTIIAFLTCILSIVGGYLLGKYL